MADGLRSGGPPNSAAAAEPPDDRASEDLAHATTLQSPTVSPAEGTKSSAASSRRSEPRLTGLYARIGTLVRAIQDNDEAKIEVWASWRSDPAPHSCSLSACSRSRWASPRRPAPPAPSGRSR
jgi:hypothetical protein